MFRHLQISINPLVSIAAVKRLMSSSFIAPPTICITAVPHLQVRFGKQGKLWDGAASFPHLRDDHGSPERQGNPHALGLERGRVLYVGNDGEGLVVGILIGKVLARIQ